MINSDKIICIVGPTASGKSDIANELAYLISGEVLSADSMQIYKGMDIGTGKIAKNVQKVSHWGIDIINPDQAYSVALYQQYARKVFEDAKSKNIPIVMCGGTGFYIRSAIDDYDFPNGEQINNPIREKYNKYASDNGAHALWTLLKEKDIDSANLIHENNIVRVVRALELYEEGKSYAKLANNLSKIKQVYPAIIFGLDVDPDILAERIESRVDKMIQMGLVDEVKSLLNKGYADAVTSASAIGYKEIVDYLEKRCSLEESINQIKLSTRRYAKRQRTWFRKDKRIKWIKYNEPDVKRVVDEIILCCDKDQ